MEINEIKTPKIQAETQNSSPEITEASQKLNEAQKLGEAQVTVDSQPPIDTQITVKKTENMTAIHTQKARKATKRTPTLAELAEQARRNADIEKANNLTLSLLSDPEKLFREAMVNELPQTPLLSNPPRNLVANGDANNDSGNMDCVNGINGLDSLENLGNLTHSGVFSNTMPEASSDPFSARLSFTLNKDKEPLMNLQDIPPRKRGPLALSAQSSMSLINHADLKVLSKFYLPDDAGNYEELPAEISKLSNLTSWLKAHPFYAKGLEYVPVSIRKLGDWSFGEQMLDFKVRPLLLRGVANHLKLQKNSLVSEEILSRTMQVDRKSRLPYAMVCALAHEGLSPAVASDMLYPLYTGTRRNTLVNNAKYQTLFKETPYSTLPHVMNMPINIRIRVNEPTFTGRLSRDVIRNLYAFLDIYRAVTECTQDKNAHIRFNAFDLLVALKIMRMFLLAEIEFSTADIIEKHAREGKLKTGHVVTEDGFILGVTANELEVIWDAYQEERATIKKRLMHKYITFCNIAAYMPYYADRLGNEFLYCTGSEFCGLPTYVFVYGDTPLNDLLYYNVSRHKESAIRSAVRFSVAPMMK